MLIDPDGNPILIDQTRRPPAELEEQNGGQKVNGANLLAVRSDPFNEVIVLKNAAFVTEGGKVHSPSVIRRLISI